MRWSLISVRFIAAITVFGLAICGTLLATLFAFQHLRGGFDELTTRTLPQLVETSRISEVSQAIASTAPSLASVTSSYVKKSIKQHIGDQVRTMDTYLDNLTRQTTERDIEALKSIDRIRDARDSLVENLNDLDATVGLRIEADDTLADQFRTARLALVTLEEFQTDLHTRLSARLFERQSTDINTLKAEQALSDWVNAMELVLVDILSLPTVENQAVVYRVAESAQTIFAEFQPPPRAWEASVAPSLGTAPKDVYAMIIQLLDPKVGVFSTKSERIRLGRAQKGLLNRNKLLASRFVGSAADLALLLQDKTKETSESFARIAQENSFILVGVAVLGVLAVAGLSAYARRSILHRLRALQEAMRRRVDGDDADIPSKGNDEIAEIGQAANHFIGAIMERENRLRDAKNQAENLAREAEAANRAKSVFLANMSHELRTPLNAIIGFSDLIRDGRIDPARVSEYAGDINDSGTHLLDLINDLLDYSKIEAGQRELDIEPINLAEEMVSIRKLMNIQLQKRNLSLDVSVEPDCIVRADPTALRQIMLNLLSNAAKFSYEAETIRVFTEIHDDAARITVQDRGVGIAKNQLTNVLQPFHQETTSYTRKVGGTGLGLAIVDNLVRMHGGELEIDSEKDIGTSVTVCLPHTTPADINVPQKSPAMPEVRPAVPAEALHPGNPADAAAE